jgi:hypothetical protein
MDLTFGVSSFFKRLYTAKWIFYLMARLYSEWLCHGHSLDQFWSMRQQPQLWFKDLAPCFKVLSPKMWCSIGHSLRVKHSTSSLQTENPFYFRSQLRNQIITTAVHTQDPEVGWTDTSSRRAFKSDNYDTDQDGSFHLPNPPILVFGTYCERIPTIQFLQTTQFSYHCCRITDFYPNDPMRLSSTTRSETSLGFFKIMFSLCWYCSFQHLEMLIFFVVLYHWRQH